MCAKLSVMVKIQIHNTSVNTNTNAKTNSITNKSRDTANKKCPAVPV